MDTKIFDRVEKKYLIDSSQKSKLLRAISRKMKHDKYYKSKIFNIYFDNDNFDLIIKSIEKPEFKEKLRARSYSGFDKVFLEIKTKIRGKDVNLGYKRRVLLTHDEYDEFVSGKKTVRQLAAKDMEEKTDLQIADEVDYLVDYLKLKPQILVYYERTSYKGEGDLRITFDEKLKYRDKNLKFTKNSKDKLYFNNEKNIIMEIKAGGALPLWLTKQLAAAKAYPSSFSKIGKIYETLRKEKNV